jgi:hypothetical protein
MRSEVTFPSVDDISALKNNNQDIAGGYEVVSEPWSINSAFAIGKRDGSEMDGYTSDAETNFSAFANSVWDHATSSSGSCSSRSTTPSESSYQELNQILDDIGEDQSANFKSPGDPYCQEIDEGRLCENSTNDEDDGTWDIQSYPWPENFPLNHSVNTLVASVTDSATSGHANYHSHIFDAKKEFQSKPRIFKGRQRGLTQLEKQQARDVRECRSCWACHLSKTKVCAYRSID